MKNYIKKRILIIGAGWEQLSLIEEIKKQGHFLVATHPNINGEGLKIADQYYVKDSRDISSHIEIANTHKIDAIVSDNCDFSFYTASIVASKFKLPFATIQSAIYSNDKFEQRNTINKTNVLQPVYKKVKTLDEVLEAIKIIGYPAILKPIDSRGNFGVTIIQDKNFLKEAYFDAICNSNSKTLLLEQFIEGTLVTVDGFCFKNGHQSLTVASRKFENGPKPITKEITYPALFDDVSNFLLMDTHHQVVKALNYNTGHTHGEYILTKNKEIYLVECTNRGGGVYTSSVIVPLLTDLPLNEILINQSLGKDLYEAPTMGIKFMNKAVILTFLDYEVGKVIEHINIEEVLRLPYTIRFRSNYSTNDMVESISNGAGRHSMLILSGSDSNELRKNLSEFNSIFKITYY